MFIARFRAPKKLLRIWKDLGLVSKNWLSYFWHGSFTYLFEFIGECRRKKNALALLICWPTIHGQARIFATQLVIPVKANDSL